MSAPAWLQYARLRRREGMSEGAQPPSCAVRCRTLEKRRRADFVIPTGRGKGATYAAIRRLVSTLLARRATRPSRRQSVRRMTRASIMAPVFARKRRGLGDDTLPGLGHRLRSHRHFVVEDFARILDTVAEHCLGHRLSGHVLFPSAYLADHADRHRLCDLVGGRHPFACGDRLDLVQASSTFRPSSASASSSWAWSRSTYSKTLQH